MPELAQWDSFYVLVGGAAGALIGLQFVVLTLITTTLLRSGGTTYVSPTVIHFSCVLFLAALMRVPWPSVMSLALALGAVGLAGIGYALLTARRMRRISFYRPDREDLTYHVLLPVAAHGLLFTAAILALRHFQLAMFAVAASALVLLFTAIHNAWDVVIYHTTHARRAADTDANFDARQGIAESKAGSKGAAKQ